MTTFGKISAYDTGNGKGTIKPEAGGEPLPFGKDDLEKSASQPQQGQRFSCETRQAGGTHTATNLRQQEQKQEQASAPDEGRKGEQRKQAENQQG